MQKATRSLAVALPILFAMAILQSCGGGDSVPEHIYPAEEPYQPPPELAWIEIDTPAAGQSYTKLPITVSGRAGMKDGSTPASSSIRIQFAYSSTVHDLEGTITCDPTCIVNWETTLASSDSTAYKEGDRTMRVWFEDAWDGVKINYTANRYQVYGKVTYSGSANSNDNIRLWLDDKIEARVDSNGAYQIEVREGSYVLAPRLGPIKGGCMAFSPAERSLTVNGSNVTGQDFTITGEYPCYTIQGTVSADNNPGYYADYSDRAGLISRVYMYDNGKQNQLTSAWIDYDGYYKFENIPVGYYVLTPSVSYYGTGIFGIPMYNGTPGHDTGVYITSNRWVDLYLDF